MKLDEWLYKAFLEEMSELESFRMAYAAEHPAAPLDRDDPDVRRLVEALAFFAARTRRAALRNVEASRRRIFQQFVPYLLSPLPAMGMVQASPTGQFTETLEFPKGSAVALTTGDGQVALFRTLRDLRFFPLTLGRVDTLLLPAGGFRLVLPMTVPYPRSDEIGTLGLYIDYLDDYHASLRVLTLLRSHLVKAQVVFGEKVDETTRGSPCEVTFGSDTPNDETELEHPLLRERLFFHYPRAELFLNLRLPQPPRNWRQFFLCLDLSPQWPRNLRLNRDVFQLFVTPVVNLDQREASPVVYDGTTERCPILHPETGARFSLHSVRGVYQVADNLLVPLRAGVLTAGAGTYELDETVDAAGNRHKHLLMHFPEAFETPRTISIDANWIQPWFSTRVGEKLSVTPYRRTFVGLKWDLLGEMVAHRESSFADDMDSFLHLFVLQNKSFLNTDDLVVLLQTLGSVWNGPFAQVRDMLTDVRVEQVPGKPDRRSGSLKLVYHLLFEGLDPTVQPLLDAFVRHVGRVLDAWISDAAIEVRLEGR